jgi:signal transduction histidine kinase
VVVALLAGYLADRLRRTGGELVIAEERAHAAERLAMLGRLAAGLAHEIRNPLGSISGSVEMLREAPGLTEEDRRLCDIIQGESARLNHLVGDMMDLARPTKPAPQAVDVAELARDVVALASRTERSGAGDVLVRYDGPEDAVFARCDGAQMRQVLWNLVRNGVQVSAAGTTVTVSIATDVDRVRMKVADEGPGIPEEAVAQIFDAFYTTRSHGAGIGLAVVRRIIDDHAPFGATIDVHSTAKGATFEVGLARVKAGSKSESPEASDRGVMGSVNARSHPAES